MYVLYEFKLQVPMFQTRIFLSGEIKVLPWLTEESWEEIIPLKKEEKSSNIVPYMHAHNWWLYQGGKNTNGPDH